MTLSLRPPNTPKYNCWHLFSIVMHIRSMETTKYLAVKSSIKGTCCTPIWSILCRSIKLKSLSLSALKLKMKSRCILSLTIQNELWWFRKPHQTTHLLNHVKDTWKERERERIQNDVLAKRLFSNRNLLHYMHRLTNMDIIYKTSKFWTLCSIACTHPSAQLDRPSFEVTVL